MGLPDWWPYPKPYAIMDCIEGMNALPDKCVDLVLTDPPYGIGIASDGKIGGSQKVKVKDYGVVTWDNKIVDLTECFRIGKEQIIFGGNYYDLPKTKSWLIWDKKCKNNWDDNFSDGEMAWTSFKKPTRIFRHLFMGCHKQDNTDIKEHPTQKPIALFIWIIEKYTKPGDIVLDPFLGSGTTLRACRETGRVGLGFEINPDYEPIIKKRMMEEIPRLDIFAFGEEEK